jgi:hypothetical protein
MIFQISGNKRFELYEIPFLGLYQTFNLDFFSNRKKSRSENNIGNNNKVIFSKEKKREKLAHI